MNKRNMVMTVFTVLALITVCLPTIAGAVAFKVCNDTDVTFRARIYDRTGWRPWVVCSPGYWGDIAREVKRTEHAVQVEAWNGSEWTSFYSGHHGSRMFTRVLQFMGGSSSGIVMGWWDEPPTCRDRPPHPQYGGSTCLEESGWYWGELRDLAIQAGMTYVKGQ